MSRDAVAAGLPADQEPTIRLPRVVAAAPARNGYVLPGLRGEPLTVPMPLPIPVPQPGSTQPDSTQPDPTQPDPTQQGSAGRAGGLGEGLALSLSAAVGALAGLVSWLLAARLLPQEQLGLGAAVVSAFFLVAGIMRLNLGVALMRWLPTAGVRAPMLVRRSLLAILACSAAAAAAYLAVVPELAHTTVGGGPFVVGAAMFVLTTAGWAVFVVHDYVLAAVGRAWWCVWRNVAFAAVRIGMLVLLGPTMGAEGIVLSWAAPIVAGVAVDALVLTVAVRRFARRSSSTSSSGGGVLPQRREVLGFLGPTWVAQIANTLLLNQVPLLVILRFGPEAGAAFFIAWQAAVVLETAATYFTHSMSASFARAPERAAELARTVLRQMLVIFLPVLAVGAVLAGPGLAVFGADYAEAAGVLRLLLLGQMFRLLVVHELGVRTAAGRGTAYARLHLASTGLVLAAVMLVPATTGAGVETALMPVAWGYLAVQVACAGYVAATRAPARTTARATAFRDRGSARAGQHGALPRRLAAVALAAGVAVVSLPDLAGLDRVTPFAQVVALRPYLLLGLAALVLVLAALSWRFRGLLWLTVAVQLVLAVGAMSILPRIQVAPPPTAGHPLTVLTFNTLDGGAEVTELAQLIRTERPDLAALIEVGPWYRDRLAPLVEPLGYRMITATGTDTDGVSDLYGVTALVAERLGNTTSRIDTSTPFPIVEIEGGELGATRFVAFHAVAPRRGDVGQWISDLDKLSWYCAGVTHTVVAGDFNATLDHSVLRTASTGCSDVAAQRGQGLVPTWPTWLPNWFGPQIDHVLVTQSIAADQFSVHEITGSDHRAVLTRLRIPESSSTRPPG